MITNSFSTRLFNKIVMKYSCFFRHMSPQFGNLLLLIFRTLWPQIANCSLKSLIKIFAFIYKIHLDLFKKCNLFIQTLLQFCYLLLPTLQICIEFIYLFTVFIFHLLSQRLLFQHSLALKLYFKLVKQWIEFLLFNLHHF